MSARVWLATRDEAGDGSFGFSATKNAYGSRDLYMRLHLNPEARP